MRPIHQDANNPICEGSGVLPVQEWAFNVTSDFPWAPRVSCPGCGHQFSPTREGRIRKHRRLP